jgi:hypothetical protein
MAYDFNGTNQYLSIASAVVSNVPATFAALFNIDNTTNDHRLWYVGQQAGTNRITLAARGGVAGNPIRIVHASTGIGVADSTSGFSVNVWSHATGVFTSASSRTAYFDGGSPGTETTNVGSATSWDRTFIGAQSFNNVAVAYADGRIAEAAIWNATLTAAEINSLGKGFKPYRIRPQSLILYMPLVREIQDIRQARSITNNNSATVANHPRVY